MAYLFPDLYTEIITKNPKRGRVLKLQVGFTDLIKKPWAFTRVPYMNPTILGVIGPGFLNQPPTKRDHPVGPCLERTSGETTVQVHLVP